MISYDLPGQLPNEEILKLAHRSFFIFFKEILFIVLLAVLPAVFLYLVVINFPNLFADQVYLALLILGASAYFLFILLFFFFSFIDYYLNIFVVTNERILDIQQNGFFARTIAEQRMENVQDITSEVDGPFATIFGFGNLNIQTAGEKDNFFVKNITRPNELREMIIKLVEQKRPGEPSA